LYTFVFNVCLPNVSFFSTITASSGADQYKEWFLGGINSGAGFFASLNNIYAVGAPIIKDISTNWDKVYAAGIAPPMLMYDKTLGAKVDILGTIIAPLVSAAATVVPAVIFAPKVMILCAFIFEENVWAPLKLTQEIPVPGLSSQYPNVHCNADYSVCQMTTAMGFANSAASATTLFMSPQFNFAKTYFMWAGIAGGNPELTTLGSVTFPRYTIETDLQYELDGRDVPKEFSTGYW
jgi:purine nucleoside permease